MKIVLFMLLPLFSICQSKEDSLQITFRDFKEGLARPITGELIVKSEEKILYYEDIVNDTVGIFTIQLLRVIKGNIRVQLFSYGHNYSETLIESKEPINSLTIYLNQSSELSLDEIRNKKKCLFRRLRW